MFLVFSAFSAFFAYKHYPSIVSYILIFFAVLILCLIAFVPLTLRPIFNLWMKAAHAIGWFNTQIIVSIVFALIFIPTGIIVRLFRKDPMKRKMLTGGTYWEPYELEGLKDKGRYERQF